MEALTTAFSSILTLSGTVLDTVLANPVLALLFAGGLVGMVVGIVHQLKNI